MLYRSAVFSAASDLPHGQGREDINLQGDSMGIRIRDIVPTFPTCGGQDVAA
ncbi:MAG: hypothetical protein ACH37Z_06265 [Anaerolineae bacterium]|nr:hypothetical protein [Ardenticatenia bacterium]